MTFSAAQHWAYDSIKEFDKDDIWGMARFNWGSQAFCFEGRDMGLRSWQNAYEIYHLDGGIAMMADFESKDM